MTPSEAAPVGARSTGPCRADQPAGGCSALDAAPDNSMSSRGLLHEVERAGVAVGVVGGVVAATPGQATGPGAHRQPRGVLEPRPQPGLPRAACLPHRRDGRRSVSGGWRLGAGSAVGAALGRSTGGRRRRVGGMLRFEPLAKFHLTLHPGRPTVADPSPLRRHALLRRPLAGPATETRPGRDPSGRAPALRTVRRLGIAGHQPFEAQPAIAAIHVDRQRGPLPLARFGGRAAAPSVARDVHPTDYERRFEREPPSCHGNNPL
jgi:hypothetical protein